MKKKLLVTAILGCSINILFAQSWNPISGGTYTEGSVTIGATSLYKKLTIALNQQSDGIWMSNGPAKAAALLSDVTPTVWNSLTQQGDHLLFWKNQTVDDPNAGGLVIGPWSTNANVGMRISAAGNVGIGISSPTEKLDVRGNIYTSGSMIIKGGDLILARTTHDYGFIIRPNEPNKKNLAFAVEGGGPLDYLSVNSNISYFTGGIGIGTASIGSYKLAVDGKIAARGVKVTLGSFADYVFDSTYNLRPLASLAQYINQNKHLPGIPSAEEVKKDGGIELGEMNVKLLEKIEELTLYVIELKKENEQMKKEIKEIREKK